MDYIARQHMTCKFCGCTQEVELLPLSAIKKNSHYQKIVTDGEPTISEWLEDQEDQEAY